MADVTKLMIAVWLLACVAFLFAGIAFDNLWLIVASAALGVALLAVTEAWR